MEAKEKRSVWDSGREEGILGGFGVSSASQIKMKDCKIDQSEYQEFSAHSAKTHGRHNLLNLHSIVYNTIIPSARPTTFYISWHWNWNWNE